jgi:YD repeat-containing protein
VAGAWAAAPGGYRDTLTLSASVYTRTLRHGVQVKYDAQGRHTQTISRTGQTTTFSYDGSGRLSTIAVPPGGAASTYTLMYDGVGHLDRITDPGTRVLNAAVSASNGVLSSLLDPDGVSVTFDYNGARMIGRTGRHGFRTEFAYGHGLRVTRVAVPIDAASHDTAVTTMQPWDERGLPGTTMPDTALAFTTIDGPRVGIDIPRASYTDMYQLASRRRIP